MKYQISIRQFIFLFLFTTITPLFTYVPQIAARNAGNGGYISACYFGILLFIFAALLIRICKVYPGYSYFEILSRLISRPLTRIIFFLYGIWSFLMLLYKLTTYNLLLQTTLMSDTTNYLILFGLFFIVLYAAMKGSKTIFRVAELLYGPLIIFLVIMLIFTLPNINKDFLTPVTSKQLLGNVSTLWTMAPLGGNLFFLLFFLKPITGMNRFPVVRKRILQSVFVFFLFSYLCIFLTIGLAGATLTSQYSYSLFQALKCVTFLSSFERFDAIISLVTVISDFITITFYLIILMKCFSLAFNITNTKEIAVVALTLACTIVCIMDVSQFSLEHYYRNYIDKISIAFQYIIPVLLGLFCCFKKPAAVDVVDT